MRLKAGSPAKLVHVTVSESSKPPKGRFFVHALGGGIALQQAQGKVIGAVGISRATVEADQIIAVGAARP